MWIACEVCDDFLLDGDMKYIGSDKFEYCCIPCERVYEKFKHLTEEKNKYEGQIDEFNDKMMYFFKQIRKEMQIPDDVVNIKRSLLQEMYPAPWQFENLNKFLSSQCVEGAVMCGAAHLFHSGRDGGGLKGDIQWLYERIRDWYEFEGWMDDLAHLDVTPEILIKKIKKLK